MRKSHILEVIIKWFSPESTIIKHEENDLLSQGFLKNHNKKFPAYYYMVRFYFSATSKGLRFCQAQDGVIKHCILNWIIKQYKRLVKKIYIFVTYDGFYYFLGIFLYIIRLKGSYTPSLYLCCQPSFT